MAKYVIVSNRLPVSVAKAEGRLRYTASIGGLATGLASVHAEQGSVWVGWPGVPSEDLPLVRRLLVSRRLRRSYRTVPVALSRADIRGFYHGFCNDILWPLFHYFPTYVRYDDRLWEAYRRANQRFLDAVMRVARNQDTIWVHDYQLMLLPGLLRARLPEARIGFFLHIPFPSYELLRLLPWRVELLDGLLGADLVGFHCHSYVRHFLASLRGALGVEHHLGRIPWQNRVVATDAFPMGIDYRKYAGASDDSEVREEIAKASPHVEGRRVILSIDRLDYTKGIPRRLVAFDRFLADNPDYRGKVTMILVVAPSRASVPRYAELKRTLDEQVGSINSRYGTMGWAPVVYFYRTMGFAALSALYLLADVLLVTPLRDGMNLIAKEYLAARQDRRGVLILSETAGAAEELGEALIVNPNNVGEIAAAMRRALEMDAGEREQRSRVMLRRLERYDVHSWAEDFLGRLATAGETRAASGRSRLSGRPRRELLAAGREAARSLLLLDYDGTLVALDNRTSEAEPDERLLGLLGELARRPGTTVVIVSGRTREDLAGWFGGMDVGLVAEHGAWLRERGADWRLGGRLDSQWSQWKEDIRPILERHVDRTPGSSIEEKGWSLAWHYRRADPELAAIRVAELKEALRELTANLDLAVLEGSRVVEVKSASVDKGRAAGTWLSQGPWDFILAMGDDWTDEDTFAALPAGAWSVKVGEGPTRAGFAVESVEEARRLLAELAAEGGGRELPAEPGLTRQSTA